MIYKVLYQELADEVPVRENTRSLYYQADSERQVRQALKDRNINIEFIQPIEGDHLAYEKQAEDFTVENV
ncbi:DNA-dependent RNA polymerase auxiliary subunit epsilon [Natronobacillus azotifigens]|uniref:DNA-directed RNA polymerase subunit epsilon n=1 Tax=Natronobacillus azotifigens TaxID=472978 RepID=A0A9J6RF47_9BACI|nr:DNA-directed RNA polymerase subunit epsilon [Natronobacillus azotifigens]MCZ0703963.1 DNA-directed RNA polymerase subunit epsilon [Natronobacillus azotifigens]